MSSVTSSTSNGYYQLNNQSSTTSSSTSSASSIALGAISGSSTTTTGVPSLAYILNLSDEAQSYLNGNSSTTSSIFGAASSGDSSTIPQPTTYTLSSAQQKTITSILEKYKDAPYTQATFNQIQDDLDKAGLSTTTLAAQNIAQTFNPTQYLLGALSGNAQPTMAAPTAASTATQSTNFMNSVITQWKAISTTAAAATATSTTAS